MKSILTISFVLFFVNIFAQTDTSKTHFFIDVSAGLSSFKFTEELKSTYHSGDDYIKETQIHSGYSIGAQIKPGIQIKSWQIFLNFNYSYATVNKFDEKVESNLNFGNLLDSGEWSIDEKYNLFSIGVGIGYQFKISKKFNITPQICCSSWFGTFYVSDSFSEYRYTNYYYIKLLNQESEGNFDSSFGFRYGLNGVCSFQYKINKKDFLKADLGYSYRHFKTSNLEAYDNATYKGYISQPTIAFGLVKFF